MTDPHDAPTPEQDATPHGPPAPMPEDYSPEDAHDEHLRRLDAAQYRHEQNMDDSRFYRGSGLY